MLGVVAVHCVDVVLGRAAGDGDDALELVEGGLAGEEGLVDDELADDATDGPHVDALGVLGGADDDFRRTVPSGGDVVGVDGALVAVGLECGDGAGKAEVGDLHQAVGVEEKIRGFHVTMKNLG